MRRTIDVILPQFLEFCGDAALVAHNASFDVSFIAHNAALLGLPFDPTVLDTVALARLLLPNLNRFKLDTVAKASEYFAGEPSPGGGRRGQLRQRFSLKFVEMLKEQRHVKIWTQLNELQPR